MCADCKRLYFENIFVKNTTAQCKALDLRLINVGPLSAVWKNGSENPDDWGEVFDPDAVCTVDDVWMKNIYFANTAVTDKTQLLRAVKMHINPDYPNTTPRGGTGYGVIKKVYIQ